jgi:hypothetical protein
MPYSEPPIIHLEPLEHAPQDVVIYDRTARRWTVRLSNSGQWVGLVRGPTPGLPGGRGRGNRLIGAFNADHARNLADALTWAALLVDNR